MNKQGMIDKFILMDRFMEKRKDIIALRKDRLKSDILSESNFKKGEYVTNGKDAFVVKSYDVSRFKPEIEYYLNYFEFDEGLLSRGCMYSHEIESKLKRIDKNEVIEILTKRDKK